MPTTSRGVGAAISRNGIALPAPSFPRRNWTSFRRCGGLRLQPKSSTSRPIRVFTNRRWHRFCRKRASARLLFTGAETDVCVLATVLDAVDLGFRIVIVEDALCSSSDAGHDALMTLYRTRFSEQIELIKTAELQSCGPATPEAEDEKLSLGP
jgi:hypothetical protein